MKRLYYFTKSLASVQGITGELRQAGIGENRLHVMGTDTMAIAQAHVHGTTPWEETDIMHSGFLGAIIGMAAGLFGGFLLAGLDPWGTNLESGAIIGATLFGTCFGAWRWLARRLVYQPSLVSLYRPGRAGRLSDDGGCR